MSSKTPNFEKSLAELETLVESMESGELSLEDSLAAFEKGVKLTRDCQTPPSLHIPLDRCNSTPLQPLPTDRPRERSQAYRSPQRYSATYFATSNPSTLHSSSRTV